MALPRGRLAPVLAVVSVVLLGWLVVMPFVGTTAGQPEKSTGPSRDQFAAASQAVPATISPAPFDGKRAIGYVQDAVQNRPTHQRQRGHEKTAGPH